MDAGIASHSKTVTAISAIAAAASILLDYSHHQKLEPVNLSNSVLPAVSHKDLSLSIQDSSWPYHTLAVCCTAWAALRIKRDARQMARKAEVDRRIRDIRFVGET